MDGDTIGFVLGTLGAIGFFLLLAIPLTLGRRRPVTPMKRCPLCGTEAPAARGGKCWKCGLDHDGLSQDAVRPDKPPMDLSYFDAEGKLRRRDG
jgi:hypothetical protein